MSLTDRAQALQILQEGNRALLERLDSLPAEVMERPGSLGDGDWSAKDLLGHVTTWEEAALDTIEDWRHGRPPRIDEVFEADGVDRFNAEQVEAKKAQSLAEIRSRAEAVHRALVAAIEALTDEEWTTPYKQSKRQLSLGKSLGGILGAPGKPFGHVTAHLPDLEDLVRAGR